MIEIRPIATFEKIIYHQEINLEKELIYSLDGYEMDFVNNNMILLKAHSFIWVNFIDGTANIP
jgi:hypothetical protein